MGQKRFCKGFRQFYTGFTFYGNCKTQKKLQSLKRFYCFYTYFFFLKLEQDFIGVYSKPKCLLTNKSRRIYLVAFSRTSYIPQTLCFIIQDFSLIQLVHDFIDGILLNLAIPCNQKGSECFVVFTIEISFIKKRVSYLLFNIPKAYSEPCQTSKAESFAKILNGFQNLLLELEFIYW